MTLRAMPRTPLRSALLALLVAAPLSLGTGLAQDNATTEAPADSGAPANITELAPISPDAVVATVAGETITEQDLTFAAEDLAQQLGGIAPEERRAFLLTVMIDLKLMAAAAREAGLDQTEDFTRRLDYLQDRALRRAYSDQMIERVLTPEALQAAYDAYVSGQPPQEEVHARHILVETEEEAAAIKAELDAGGNFDELAKTRSIDPSAAQNAGDLGFFTREVMVAPFAEAAFALQAGETSAPVQTDFGWHVIRLDERRPVAAPTLQELGPQLQQQLLMQNFDETMAALRAQTTIDIPDPALAAQVNAESTATP